MTFGLDEYQLSVLTIFMLLVPAAFYSMGLLEGRKGHYLFLSGIFLHLLSIAHRWALLGRLPLAEKHDNISFMALAMAFIYLYFHRRKGVERLSLLAPPAIAIFMLVAAGHRPIDTISPFMNSPWFYLHIFFYFLSYGFFGVSAMVGVLYVLGGGAEHEHQQYRGAVHGWIMLSFALFAGSIWFYFAYGTYWLWTSREMWITFTWLFYGLYLHARYMKSFKGRPAGVLGILGFAAALFTYFGVGTVIKSPPTQF